MAREAKLDFISFWPTNNPFYGISWRWRLGRLNHIGVASWKGREVDLRPEGRRGTPRIRPPFPVERGYLGQPTVVNNVETYCAVSHIAAHGGAWWAAIGTAMLQGRSGLSSTRRTTDSAAARAGRRARRPCPRRT